MKLFVKEMDFWSGGFDLRVQVEELQQASGPTLLGPDDDRVGREFPGLFAETLKKEETD